MDITVWKCWMLFHVLLSLPGLGFACFRTGSVTDSPTTDSPTIGKCDIQLTHRCFITTRSTNDTILSNYTIWACANGGDTSIRWSPDCCLDDNVIDAVLNLTTELSTKIECSPFSSNPTATYMYKWRMDAPTKSKILLRVRHFDGSTINARDDSGIAYNFPTNSFVTDGDSFISSSNSVIMEVDFKEPARPHNLTVWVRAFEIINTINIANGTQECTLPPSITDGNQWNSETACADGLYTFEDSCYQFNANSAVQLSAAKENCEAMRGYHLVYIESSEEQTFLTSVAKEIKPPRSYWIGIKKNEEGRQVWMDGSSITFRNLGEINNAGECFLLNFLNYHKNTWVERSCSKAVFRYICERERGYIGSSPNHGGCVTFNTTLPANLTNEGVIMLKFSYYIKTYENATIVWRGNHVMECRPDDNQTLFRKGLQINISCDASFKPSKQSNPWLVTFHAKGAGLVQLKDVQLIIYSEPESTDHADNRQSSGRTAGTAVAIVMVLLVVVLVAAAGFLWYKRRQRHAASNRKPQLQNQEDHIHNPTYENSVDQGDRNEYADSIDPVLGSPNYVNHFVASGLDQTQLHPGARSDFSTNDDVVIDDGEHVYSSTLDDEGEDGYHEYSILERDLEKEPVSEDVGNRSWDGKPKTPFQGPDQESDDSYDHFQRRGKSGPPNHNQFAKKQTDDDYRASRRVEEDADSTYQVLDDGQEDQDNEDYSHLQRPLGNILSTDEPRLPDSGNQYGELKGEWNPAENNHFNEKRG